MLGVISLWVGTLKNAYYSVACCLENNDKCL